MKYLLILFSVFSCYSAFGQVVKPDKDDDLFSFVFMTDIHLQSEKNAIQGFKKAIETVNELNPDFVITGGDNIMDVFGQTWERSDSLYNLFDSMIGNFNVPVYTTIGNHDLFGISEKSGISPSHPEYGKEMYKKRLAQRYYSFEYKDWDFIVLDGVGITDDRRYKGYVDDEQINWLQKELQRIGKISPIIISIHIPLLSVESQIALGPTEAFKDNSIVNNANEIRDELRGYDVKVVLQGHTHFLEDIYYEGVHYVTGGAVSGSIWNGKRYEMEEGFLLVNIKKNNTFSWKYIDFGWEVQ
jgi:predicted phosphodiesterase